MSHWVSQNLSQGIHVYSGGEGSTVVLVPGWPETAEAYSELFPLLAQDHGILCVDPPGLGDSAPSEIGYDTGAISRTLEQVLRSRAKDSFHLVGHDAGSSHDRGSHPALARVWVRFSVIGAPKKHTVWEKCRR